MLTGPASVLNCCDQESHPIVSAYVTPLLHQNRFCLLTQSSNCWSEPGPRNESVGEEGRGSLASHEATPWGGPSLGSNWRLQKSLEVLDSTVPMAQGLRFQPPGGTLRKWAEEGRIPSP